MIVFFGPAGAGKSMQGQILAARQGWRWLSTGQILRDAHDPEINKSMHEGKLISPELSNRIMGEAIKKAVLMLKSKYWPIIGSTFIVQMIVQITLGIFTLIPYFIGIITVFSNPESLQQNPDNAISFVMILLLVIVIISIIFNYTLQNIVLINQGVIFYSCKEEMENVSINNNIDLIGTDEA